MAPDEIEDTSDWMGCPTELETCRHFLRMFENEVQELTLQLRRARENTFNLVNLHADVSNERDTLRSELAKVKAELSDAKRAVVDIETKSNWQLMAKDKAISELTARVKMLRDQIPTAPLS
ncbi:hypothetical protein PS918_03152 [Pseudomonas fluorescens]|uniref:Uncharacterized protein n=1 Tax=Pseudomonas fluorescens TaxID=294 RepID=A0A5E7SUK4_PSEFL|nr:hypothetical protein [Pseudomonas fluorescens]VVP90136.1 hypothetical protein PS918_03152 [Pseudomonas fluorescens]